METLQTAFALTTHLFEQKGRDNPIVRLTNGRVNRVNRGTLDGDRGKLIEPRDLCAVRSTGAGTRVCGGSFAKTIYRSGSNDARGEERIRHAGSI